jgi:hypothetical protein
MSCKVIKHPNLMDGYGCCKCKTYNGDHRTHCKQCNHARCDSINTESNEDDSDVSEIPVTVDYSKVMN